MALIKKLTMSAIMGDYKKILPQANGKKLPLCRVWGKAHRYETGESSYGPWVKFKGSFKAINYLSGEEFEAGNCFLPGVAADMVEPLVCDPDITAVEFAFEFHMIPDDSPIGFHYEAKSLVEAAEDSSMMRLEKTLPKLPRNVPDYQEPAPAA